MQSISKRITCNGSSGRVEKKLRNVCKILDDRVCLIYFKKIETLVEVDKCLENSQKWLENAGNGRLADASMTKEDEFNGSSGRLGSRQQCRKKVRCA